MDDKIKSDQNQTPVESDSPTPIFDISETNPASEQVSEAVPQDIVPEEISPDVTSATSEAVGAGGDYAPPTDVPPPVYEENKNKYYFIIGGVVFFILLFLVIFKILFKGAGATPQNITLEYWGLWEDKEAMDGVISDYQKKYPNIKINYEKMAPQDYRDKLLARSRNGTGPDIFRFHNTWLPEIQELVSALPQTVMSNAIFEKTFYKIHQTDLKIGSYYYGIPLEIDGLVLIYNAGLLSKAGIAVPPATWEDLIDNVSRLTVKDKNGGIVTSGIALGTSSNVSHFSDIFGLMLAQNGGDIKNLDKPEASGALESYRKFAEPPKSFWSDNMPDSLAAFIQEKVAMIIAPSWVIVNIKTTNPDLQVKVATVPSVPGTSPVSIANYWVEGVSKKSKNQLEAWKFVKYLSDRDTMTKLYEAQSKIRFIGEPYSRTDLASLLSQNDYLGPVIKSATSFVSMPLISKTYDNGLNDQIVQYIASAIDATAQGASYADALKTANKGVSQILTKFKIQ